MQQQNYSGDKKLSGQAQSGKPPYQQVLRSLAARMPKVIREHEILRVAASIVGQNQEKSSSKARKEILAWAQRRCGGRLPKEAWDFHDFEYLSGGRNSVGIRILGDNSDLWAIRADDPDKTVAGRTWTTEVVIGRMEGAPVRFSARLLASTSEDSLDIEPHTPGFVQQVVEGCGLSFEGDAVSAKPWEIKTSDEAWKLIELLDRQYRLPVFVISVPDEEGDPKPLIDAEVLARATLGLAHVVVLPAPFTWILTDEFGRIRSVFGGAVRAYLPGFSGSANPYSHRLVLAEQLTKAGGSVQCVRWLRSLAANESIRRNLLGKDVLSFSSIRSEALTSKQNQLKKEGASDGEQLLAANEQIKVLREQLTQNAGELEYFDTEHKRAEERAEAAEEQLRSSTFRVQQLLAQLQASGQKADQDILMPADWAAFASWCDINFSGCLALAPAARRGTRAPEFEDVRLAARCIKWLATECRDRRIGGGEGSLAEEVIEDGIRNSHCGSDQYDFDWQGQKCTADWHIKSGGNTRDPKRCLRIYYFWDASAQQIVVADMPAHRRTGAS